MKVLVAAKQLKVTEAMRAFIEAHVEKLLKLHKRITKVSVYLEAVSKKTNDPQANAVTFELHIPGKNIVIKKKATDMYVAVSDAAHAALRHLRKQYDKRLSMRKVGVAY